MKLDVAVPYMKAAFRAEQKDSEVNVTCTHYS